MGHIHTGAGEYDFTVGAYIIRHTPQGYEALLHLHKSLGKWLPFGGHIDLNETPWQAILREIEEESGYTRSHLRVIQPKNGLIKLTDVNVLPQPLFIASYDYNETHNHTDIAYAFIVDSELQGATLEDESSVFEWYNESSLEHLTAEDVFSNTVEVYKYVLQLLDKGWQILPVSEIK